MPEVTDTGMNPNTNPPAGVTAADFWKKTDTIESYEARNHR
jgi:hypothetical protein